MNDHFDHHPDMHTEAELPADLEALNDALDRFASHEAARPSADFEHRLMLATAGHLARSRPSQRYEARSEARTTWRIGAAPRWRMAAAVLLSALGLLGALWLATIVPDNKNDQLAELESEVEEWVAFHESFQTTDDEDDLTDVQSELASLESNGSFWRDTDWGLDLEDSL